MGRRSKPIHPWYQSAINFGDVKNSWCVVERDSQEWIAWQGYFERRPEKWIPLQFKDAAHEVFTAPCRWPVWLPSDFEAQVESIKVSKQRPVWIDNAPTQAPRDAALGTHAQAVLEGINKRKNYHETADE